MISFGGFIEECLPCYNYDIKSHFYQKFWDTEWTTLIFNLLSSPANLNSEIPDETPEYIYSTNQVYLCSLQQ